MPRQIIKKGEVLQLIHNTPNSEFLAQNPPHILLTLYELSLSNVTYMSLGGHNILAPESDQSYNFGFNRMVWIDD